MASSAADMNTLPLLQDIERVFRDVCREDGVTLHEAEVIDSCGSDKKRRQGRRKDTDARWQDVPDKMIENHYSILSFLDIKGFRYYLPAYMRWSLKHFQVSDSAASDFTIYALAPRGKGKLSKTDGERFAAFTPEQCAVIYRFLRFMATRSDGRADEAAAQNALDAHWAQFCENVSQRWAGT